jgi:hypothetical protein
MTLDEEPTEPEGYGGDDDDHSLGPVGGKGSHRRRSHRRRSHRRGSHRRGSRHRSHHGGGCSLSSHLGGRKHKSKKYKHKKHHKGTHKGMHHKRMHHKSAHRAYMKKH